MLKTGCLQLQRIFPRGGGPVSESEPCGVIFSHLEPFSVMWSHLEPFGAIFLLFLLFLLLILFFYFSYFSYFSYSPTLATLRGWVNKHDYHYIFRADGCQEW